MSSSLKTPVLFLIFNRPDVTFRVFEEIRKAEPKQLFIAADGPRENKEGEAERCEQARSILKKIDWNCEVKTMFLDKNLGCRDAVSSAITWFFNNVEEGIILEDDCLPNQNFFTFCQTLLEKYRDNERIMHIGGANFQDGIKRGSSSYYFSVYPGIWGWATWKRAWGKYLINMDDFESFRKNQSIFNLKPIADYNLEKLSKTFIREISTWDYQWMYSVWKNNGICIIPNLNLISNIGFGVNATHTIEKNSFLAEIPVYDIGIIKHPEKIIINNTADDYYSWKLVGFKGNLDYRLHEIKKKFIQLIYPIYKALTNQIK